MALELYQLIGESLNELKIRDHGHIVHIASEVKRIEFKIQVNPIWT
ncbi:hypothetical protein ACFL4Z_01280 [candidate division KSB1 bacterium]